jgi:hypothetical protein
LSLDGTDWHGRNAGRSRPGQTCTSHVERHNLTIRTQNRRFTRLTNAFSKKWENHRAMFSLFAASYNFCRKHQTLNDDFGGCRWDRCGAVDADEAAERIGKGGGDLTPAKPERSWRS